MPPLVGVAVNVTLVPEQIVLPGFAPTLTEGVTVAFTVTDVGDDVAEHPLASVTRTV